MEGVAVGEVLPAKEHARLVVVGRLLFVVESGLWLVLVIAVAVVLLLVVDCVVVALRATSESGLCSISSWQISQSAEDSAAIRDASKKWKCSTEMRRWTGRENRPFGPGSTAVVAAASVAAIVAVADTSVVASDTTDAERTDSRR